MNTTVLLPKFKVYLITQDRTVDIIVVLVKYSA